VRKEWGCASHVFDPNELSRSVNKIQRYGKLHFGWKPGSPSHDVLRQGCPVGHDSAARFCYCPPAKISLHVIIEKWRIIHPDLS
jgi:hypothetical protein